MGVWVCILRFVPVFWAALVRPFLIASSFLSFFRLVFAFVVFSSSSSPVRPVPAADVGDAPRQAGEINPAGSGGRAGRLLRHPAPISLQLNQS